MFKGTFRYIVLTQVLMLIVFSVSLYLLNSKLRITETKSIVNSTFMTSTEDLSSQIHQMITIAEGLIENHQFTDWVIAGKKKELSYHGGRYLRTVQNLNRVSYLWYLSPEGKLLANIQGEEYSIKDYSHFEAFKMAKTSGSYGMAFANAPTGQPMFTVVVPISSEEEKNVILAYIVVGTELKDLFKDLIYENGRRVILYYEKSNLEQGHWDLRRTSQQTAWSDLEDWMLISFSGQVSHRSEYIEGAKQLKKGDLKLTYHEDGSYSAPLLINGQPAPQTRLRIYVDEVQVLNLAEKLSWMLVILMTCMSAIALIALFIISRKLQLQKNQLDMAAKMATLGELSSGIIHEIKNPLTVIQTSATLLERMSNGEVDVDKLQRHSSKISRMVQRVNKIADIISIYSRRSTNDPFVKVHLSSIVEDSTELVKDVLLKKGIDLKVDIKDMEIECRGIQLSQVLVNLIKNASDAIQDLDEKWIEVHSEVNSDSNQLVLTVTDSGKGLSKEVAEKLFTKFYTTKGAGQGTGLGLSICASIVEAHKGKIYVDRRAENTRFIVELPIRQ